MLPGSLIRPLIRKCVFESKIGSGIKLLLCTVKEKQRCVLTIIYTLFHKLFFKNLILTLKFKTEPKFHFVKYLNINRTM